MAFEGLTEKISASFKKLRNRGRLTESDVRESMREVRLALLEADVNYKVAKNFGQKVTERAIGADITKSLTPAQTVIKIVNEELTILMGDTDTKFDVSSKMPSIVMFCGLQGSGKTTHAAKIALMLKKQGHRPLLVAGDVYRPAAIKQMQILGESISVPVFEMGQISVLKIAKSALSFANDHGNDVVLFDTAGRLHIDDEMMTELRDLKTFLNPQEILLVVDSMTGQDAVNVAQNFNESLDISGIVLSKLDGDTRGGAALSIRSVTGKPIKFVGTGEKLENIEKFHPERMASRILGMGDVLSLIEDATAEFDERKAQKMAKKLEKNSFDLDDLKDYFIQIKKMGSIKSVLSKLPGVEQKIQDVDIDDKFLDRIEATILSMTPKERRKPEIIDASRKKRIAKGSGNKVEDVNKLLKQYEQMKKMMKGFGKFKKGFMKFGKPNF